MSLVTPLLEMRGISKRFGATYALRGVDFSVQPGEVLALVGENGAGKSTLMKILSGALSPDSGTILLQGQPYTPRGPHDARTAGVAMIYQELNLAPDLSVEDNIMLGREHHAWGWLHRGAQRRRAREALSHLGQADLPLGTLVGRLPLAVQQLVEVARAIAFSARLIVFDEPTSSLTQADAQRLFQVIGGLKQRGIAVVYISHFLEEVRAVADHYCVLRDGATAGAGSLAQVTEQQLISMMVGRNVDELFPQVPHEPGEILLKIEGLSGAARPRDVQLTVRRGEILGLAGLVGSGRTELLRTVFGLDPVRTGSVRVAAYRVPPTPRASIAAGLGLVSEDRKTEGLAQNLSIADNMTLSRLGPYSRAGWLNLRSRARAVDRFAKQIQLKAHSIEQPAAQLSGGNQQKVAIARLLHQEADVLLLDEPTRGIDIGTKSEIYRQLGELAASGKAIVFVSSYLPELMAVCDRIAVMSRGRLREVRATADWTEHQILSCAIGN